jgi:catechol 2,3-dioxygenase-like lactoylglutathione lyase family enzyme
MQSERRPGPKPKRLYWRIARVASDAGAEWPTGRKVLAFVRELERVGRLIAHGALTRPKGDLVIFRAADFGEAERILRLDPFRAHDDIAYELLEWHPEAFGSGVNLEPAPGRGSGRLTVLQRVAVVVRDQDRAVQWYRDVLGLAVRVREPESGYVELALGRGAAALSLVAPRPQWGEPYYSETMARVGARTGIVFQTDSVPALELRLRHAGARITQGPEPQPWGGLTLGFADPDDNEFLAFQPGRVLVSAHGRRERRAGARPRSRAGALARGEPAPPK